ncbi:hypothetical protein SEPCBS119000_006005 [Sporothrix epigloea]|uniref:HTH CENPB-type domain-containing protein n=1 Tax=Sporothrix epigloea TaxID=1892477 RepID=A0ABP0E0M2_9PEZI
MASPSVKLEDNHVQDTTQHNGSSWSNMSDYPQTTMASYDHSDYTYMPPIVSDLSPQPQQSRPPMHHPPLSVGHGMRQHQLPQLHMHSVPSNPTWPSMLTNPSRLAASSSTVLYLPRNRPSGLPLPSLKSKLGKRCGRTGPRKTLTDDDRRRMCEYARANPGVKQADIGSIFGVERSTVSKVLRNKEKYFFKARSPVSRKERVKLPGVERALSNWVRNAQRSGMLVTDAAIRDRFVFFLQSTGNHDSYQAYASSTWLEKFKQKNGLSARQPVQRAPEISDPDARNGSSLVTAVDSPSLVPMEPTCLDPLLSPQASLFSVSPRLRDGGDVEQQPDHTNQSGADRFMGFGAGNSTAHASDDVGMCNNETPSYKPGSSQSSTTLPSLFTPTPVSSASPATPFPFSPTTNLNSLMVTELVQRPHSLTLPALNVELAGYLPGQHQPAYHESCGSYNGGDSPVWSPCVRRFASSSGCSHNDPWSAGGYRDAAATDNTVSGTKGYRSPFYLPTQEDALRAAETLFRFMRSLPGVFNQADHAELSHLVNKVHLQSKMCVSPSTFGCDDEQRHAPC